MPGKDRYACVQHPETIKSDQCPAKSDGKCYTMIFGDATIRGCYSDYREGVSNTSSVCNGTDCNNKIFPEKRLHCYQCSNLAQNDKCSVLDEKDETLLLPCLIYKESDECYVKLNKTSDEFYRGCLSEYASREPCKKQENCIVETCKDSKCNKKTKDEVNHGSVAKFSVLLCLILCFMNLLVN